MYLTITFQFNKNIPFNRYNVGCSKRIGLFKNPEESPSKRIREDGGMEETDGAPQLMASELKEAEASEMEVDGAVVEGDGTTVESPSKTQRIDILKWTVRYLYTYLFFTISRVMRERILPSYLLCVVEGN